MKVTTADCAVIRKPAFLTEITALEFFVFGRKKIRLNFLFGGAGREKIETLYTIR